MWLALCFYWPALLWALGLGTSLWRPKGALLTAIVHKARSRAPHGISAVAWMGPTLALSAGWGGSRNPASASC